MNIARRAMVHASALVLLLSATGCKSRGGTPQTAAQKYAAAPAAGQTGSVSGTVLLSGTPPKRIPIDMSQDPACSLAGENLTEQVVADDGHLANVFVYVKGAPSLQPASAPVVMDQKGCRFVPHVVAVAAGGSVEFHNSDPTMHNVHTMPVQVGNRSVDVSQGPGGKPEQIGFHDAEEMLPVRCNNHPWMNGFVNVSPNTFFAVTGRDGNFHIDGLPAGAYTLVFVHEKLGRRELPVQITAQQNTSAKLSFAAPGE